MRAGSKGRAAARRTIGGHLWVRAVVGRMIWILVEGEILLCWGSRADRRLVRSIGTAASLVDRCCKAESEQQRSELTTIAALAGLHTGYGCSILQRWVVASEIPDQE